MTGRHIETDRIVDAIRSDVASLRETLDSHYATLAPPGYTVPMAWRCAVEMSNQIVDAVPHYSSAEHGSVFKALLAVVRRTLSAPRAEFVGPHFDYAMAYDHSVQTCLEGEYEQLSHFNLEVSLLNDYWRLFYEPEVDSFRLALAPPQRRSALVLIDHKAEFLAMTPEIREIFTKDSSSGENRTIPLSLAIGMREVEFLAHAVPKDWQELATRLGFTLEEGVQFQAFIQSLMQIGKSWFRIDDLLEMFKDFATKRSLPLINDDKFRRLVDFFSLSPEVAETFGIAVPFVRFDHWFAYWPFVHHILPPSLTFLSLLIRKHSDDWNNSVGSNLAEVAAAVRQSLPKMPGLLFATTKKKVGVGDIDLAVYDLRSRVLLLCEIKTVFDRFRTNYQQSNFTEQRVNFNKASKQLAVASEAIEKQAWSLSEIFQRKIQGKPSRILPLVLTWYDQHNPWLGVTNRNPESCNFRVFQYLFSQAGGNLAVLYEAISQLSRIYCVAALPRWQLPKTHGSVQATREVQTGLLPPQNILNEMPLAELVRREVGSLAKLPTDWEDQLAAIDKDAARFYIYGFDEQ
jgi:hypothetical protein